MTAEPKAIKELGNFKVSEDGQQIQFTIVDAGNTKYPFFCRTNEIEKLVAVLLDQGQNAYARWPDEQKKIALKPAEQLEGWLVEAFDMNIEEGRSPDETILALQLGYMILKIGIPTYQMKRLADLINEKISNGSGPSH